MNASAILLFGKYPRQGHVKTRLAASIGPKAATEFYKICLQNILSDASTLAKNHEIDIYFCFGDLSDADNVRSMTPNNICTLAQIEAGLPERILDAFTQVFSRGYSSVCIFSTDVPTLTQDKMLGAVEWLKSSEIVLGADGDGGYYALGMRSLQPNLINVSYGDVTAGMYEQTIKKIKTAGLSATLLPTVKDVDTIDDLKIFKASHTQLWQTRYADHMG